jgi:hypothetical protein
MNDFHAFPWRVPLCTLALRQIRPFLMSILIAVRYSRKNEAWNARSITTIIA